MKQKKKSISRVLTLTLLLALAGTPQFTLLRQVSAQDPNGISMPTLQLRALNIDNEVRQITSLTRTHVTFFKRAEDHRKKGGLTSREARELQTEGDQRKSDVLTIKRELESLINRLKQGNHWDAAFDAQFAASLKTDKDRSLLNQVGGARKLFEAALGEVSSLRDDIDDELRQVSAKKGPPNNRSERSFAAHARPPAGKVCTILLTAILLTSLNGLGGSPFSSADCLLVKRYNQKGCIPGPVAAPNCS
jgi:hypothetical protein